MNEVIPQELVSTTLSLLGRRAEDKITGFEGVITSVCFDLYGCVQAVISPAIDKDGKLKEGAWFDVKRLTIGAVMYKDRPLYEGTLSGKEKGAQQKPLP